ncbi:MAG: MarR family transcriptional regulator [Acidimicrobiales bacterium]|nr:MarR family transcriptional regulator [Acidimicrobiales bacterium]
MALEFDPIEEAGRNWDQAAWGATAAMKAATSITRAQQIVQSRIDAALAPLDLNFSRFEVLALLRFTRLGELPMGKIGDRLQVHAASVTNTIQRLEASGFVERTAHPDDGRAVLARLLPAGRAVVDDAAAVLAEIEFGVGGLPPSSRRTVHRELAAFREANGDFS